MNIFKKLCKKQSIQRSEETKEQRWAKRRSENRTKAIELGKKAIKVLPGFRIIATSGPAAIIQKGKMIRIVSADSDRMTENNSRLPYEWPDDLQITGENIFAMIYHYHWRKSKFNLKDADCPFPIDEKVGVDYTPYDESEQQSSTTL